MTQPIHLIAEIYALEVPEGSIGHEIVQTRPETIVLHFYVQSGYIENKSDTIVLSPGNWQLICTTKECTEEQAKELVKELPVGARWYNYNGGYPVWWHSAKESLRSLLASKGLDINKNYVLIKKLP